MYIYSLARTQLTGVVGICIKKAQQMIVNSSSLFNSQIPCFMQYVQLDYPRTTLVVLFLEKEMLVFFYICALPYIIKVMHNVNVMYHQEIEGVHENP